MILFKNITGISLLILPWLCVAAMRLFGLISFNELSENFLIFIFIFGLVNVIGYILGRFLRVRPIITDKKSFIRFKDKKSGESFIFFLAIIYIILNAVDFFITKGGTLSTITEIRESDNITGSRMSIIGGIIALTSAAPYILLCMTSYFTRTGQVLRSKLPFILALLGIGVGFLSGGRNSFLIGIAIFGFQSLYIRRNNNFIKKSFQSSRRYLQLVMAISILFSFYIFLERETQQGVSIRNVLSNFSLKWNVDIVELSTDSSLIQGLYAIFVIAIFYATHALSYIDQYFVQEASPLLSGAYNFPIIAKMIDFIFNGGVFTSLADHLIVAGVYLTLPGSLYLDFGYSGAILFGFTLSIVSGYLDNDRVTTSFRKIQFLSLLSTIWILSPIYNALSMANGFSYIFLLIILSIISNINITIVMKKQ